MKTILITGSSSGIGKQTAKLFARNGWNVVATMRKPEEEEELSRIKNITLMPLDVTDEDSVNSAVEATLEKFGQIDVLLNNAGYGAVGPLEAATYDHYFNQFNTNFFGYIRMIRAVAPSMRARRKGLIISISSVAEITGGAFGSLYHSSKWAISGLMESIQYELEMYSIRVKMVLPPPVDTRFWDVMDVMHMPEAGLYEKGLDNSYWLDKPKIRKTSIQPETVAKVIYKAATDGKKKLRYNIGAGHLIWFGRKLLPSALIMWLTKKATE